jgi:amino acid adenylation domain-containing protein
MQTTQVSAPTAPEPPSLGEPPSLSEPRSVGEMFLRTAERFPDLPAVHAGGHTLTYAELLTQAAAVRDRILSLQDRTQDLSAVPVAVFAYRSPMAYAAVMGALLAGCMYSPLNPRFPMERNRAILQSAGATILLVDGRCSAEASRVLAATDRRLTVILLDGCSLEPGLASRHDISRLHAPIDRSSLRAPVADPVGAYVLFTSGSTGTPKGVHITHRNVLAYVAAIQALFQPCCNDRFCHLADLTFDISVHDMFACWSVGACLYVVPERDIASPAAFVRTHALTFWFSVPSAVSFMDKFRTLPPGALPSLRCSLFCGEALFEQQARIWQLAAPNNAIHNLYGPTEATVAFTNYTWRLADDSAHRSVVPMGWPLPNQHVVLVDDHLAPVPSGAIGEVCLGGSQVAAGYWRDPARTADRFVQLRVAGPERWYRTGDLAQWDEHDGLIFHGRVDQQVKIRGFRVELEEVEKTLRDAVRTEIAIAVGWPEDTNGAAQGITAFVAASGAIDEAAAKHACRRNLPDYMVPTRVLPLATVPLNANGKIDRLALKTMLRDGKFDPPAPAQVTDHVTLCAAE